MSDQLVSGYADGLLAVARAEGAVEAISGELFSVATAVDGNDDLRTTISDAAIPIARRQQVVEDLVGGRASTATTALVSMVIAAGRGAQLAEIARAVGEKVAESHGRQLAEVRSAVPLTDEQVRRLAEALGRSTGGEVEVRVVVDPTVVGGLVTQIGDTVIDGSVRHRLTRMRDSFSAS